MSDPRRARRRIKAAVMSLALLPGGLLLVRGVAGSLGANPIERVMNTLGYWTLVVLLASLACTPLKLFLGWTWPTHARKPLGLVAALYASLHFVVYVVLDQGLAWDEILEDVVRRRFITVGFLAFVILIPLAVTSRASMVKRLGFPRWKRLHRLVYLAAVLGVLHFAWRVKADYTQPIVFAFVLAVLFAARGVAWLRQRRRPVAAGGEGA